MQRRFLLPLRIAAVLALTQFLAHTTLLLSYSPTHGPLEVAVIDAMRAHAFDFGGFAPHTYWDMYLGYGLFAAVNCLIEAVLFWQLPKVALHDLERVRPIIALFAAANLGYAVLVWKYFFVIPLLFDVAIASCLFAALLLGRTVRLGHVAT